MPRHSRKCWYVLSFLNILLSSIFCLIGTGKARKRRRPCFAMECCRTAFSSESLVAEVCAPPCAVLWCWTFSSKKITLDRCKKQMQRLTHPLPGYFSKRIPPPRHTLPPQPYPLPTELNMICVFVPPPHTYFAVDFVDQSPVVKFSSVRDGVSRSFGNVTLTDGKRFYIEKDGRPYLSGSKLRVRKHSSFFLVPVAETILLLC